MLYMSAYANTIIILFSDKHSVLGRNYLELLQVHQPAKKINSYMVHLTSYLVINPWLTFEMLCLPVEV